MEKEIEANDYLNIERVTSKTTVLSKDVDVIESMIRKYIDPKASVCRQCPAQIRYAYKRLSDWFSTHKVIPPSESTD